MPRINSVDEVEHVEPEEVSDCRGYYYFPEDRRIAVNKLGSIYNVLYKKIFTAKNFYNFNASVYVDGIKVASYPIGYVMARTFVGRSKKLIDKPFSELVVNFIDTFRAHVNPDNLEWISKSQERNLKKKFPVPTKKTPVLAYNLKTKGISQWKSYVQAANFFNIPVGWMWTYLRRGIFKTHHHSGFVFKFDDNSPWEFDAGNLDQITEHTEPISFKITDIFNNTTIICDLDQVSEILGVDIKEFHKARGLKKVFVIKNKHVEQISGLLREKFSPFFHRHYAWHGH